ncbi:MAG: hypothetical protein GX594_06110 [Pirellulaceae bacterium]|nr:hypothetical protein [Pirellulaceae bacterium]
MNIVIKIIPLALLLAVPLGCGKSDSLDRKILEGDITCGGKKVASGTVRFVPIEDTAGPMTAALIIDGHYRAFNRGGVPLGKHRVEIQAQRATGEKIKSPDDGKMVDRTTPVGAKQYGGPDSPLTIEVTAEGDTRFDFDVPE